MIDATKTGYSKIGSAEVSIYVDNARTMDDNRPGWTEGKVNIVTKEKQTDANSKVYQAMHLSDNSMPTMPNKTNKTPILISS